ncbi:F-box domain-containing protein [Colletotrichum asianum]
MLLYAVIKSCLPVEHISIEFGDLMAGCICVIPKMLLLLRNLERAFLELSQLLLVPGLRTLHLGFLDCTISELTALLERHEATLRTVSLESVSLIGEGLDSWLLVVAFLRHELSVEVLYLEGCFGEDAEHRTHITLLRSLYAENP